MKILMLSSYVTINSRPKYRRNRTGFGYMVYDIARSVAEKEDVDVLLSDTRDEAFKQDSIRFLPRSYGLFFRYLWQCLSIGIVIGMWKKYRMGKGASVRLLYYWLISGYYRHVLRTGHYDIVHIHGCRFNTELWIRLCQQEKQKFVVTLHGLNSFSDTVPIEPADWHFERDFLRSVADGEIAITVISTGMKRIIETEYQQTAIKNVSVVCNSFSFLQDYPKLDVRAKYGIPHDAKIVLYVGNLSQRKNQGAVVRAFNLLPKELANKTYVLFLGKPAVNPAYNISELTKHLPYKKHLIACGAIDKELVPNYYAQGDAVALMSISEGFGLSLIEGMHFGLPCMCFDDIDAYEDIYAPEAVVGVKEHTDESVAKGLETLLTTKWDKEAIRKASERFEADTMADNYIRVFNNILNA